MLDANHDIKLADFGGTKCERSIQAGGVQTTVFSRFWADVDARYARYSKTSEVYAFGLLVYFMIFGKPLFGEANA